ncbi:MAG: putative SAM-dependent methyltransferase [Candidatus Ozemobacter sibiricus]|uniref:Putative SAM-dependent methyltransferase n=1 Tax=Candidatus Ozemobacter sibiricus TaxID=2268124 RepID=A0A367ZK71_9BACT|nr:MAG: putative SAM-dependent methyltransferase [Candidatus Ozemobacter sibiricus]
MQAFGMRLDKANTRPVSPEDRVHIEKVWTRYEAYQSGHRAGIAYPLPPKNPFDDWEIAQRYQHRSTFDQTRVETHRTGARAVRTLVAKAHKEGLV